MKMITITLADDSAEPPCTYIGDLDPRLAATACYEAYESLLAELPGMTIDRTAAADWQP